MESLLNADFDRVCDLSIRNYYDFIVVGSGIGGGIVARKLVEDEKRVLLIEKGGLDFQTHCLNTSRPSWQRGGVTGPSQDNDVVFNEVKQKVHTAEGSDPYVGGPVYCLGGRSTVWGLYSPKIDDKTLVKYFPKDISEDLQNKDFYKRAFNLMTHGSQDGDTYPNRHRTPEVSGLKNRIVDDLSCKLEELEAGKFKKFNDAQIAAEFASNDPYRYCFPRGAYSTVDALLNFGLARNEHLTILLNTEVLDLKWKAECAHDNRKVEYLTICPTSNPGHRRKVTAKTAVILCAGTIGTAVIALNSGLDLDNSKIGVGLVDHEIWGVRILKDAFELQPPMKLDCMTQIGEDPALINICINANSFLGRGEEKLFTTQYLSNTGKLLFGPTGPLQETMTITFELSATLQDENKVLNSPTSTPVIRIKRQLKFQDENTDGIAQMQKIAEIIRNVIFKLGTGTEGLPLPSLHLADFGVVAHEVGTMRLQKEENGEGVVNQDLLVQKFTNLYICDLSIFPVSPPANPTLTLAALAIRLAEHLVSKSKVPSSSNA